MFPCNADHFGSIAKYTREEGQMAKGDTLLREYPKAITVDDSCVNAVELERERYPLSDFEIASPTRPILDRARFSRSPSSTSRINMIFLIMLSFSDNVSMTGAFDFLLIFDIPISAASSFVHKWHYVSHLHWVSAKLKSHPRPHIRRKSARYLSVDTASPLGCQLLGSTAFITAELAGISSLPLGLLP